MLGEQCISLYVLVAKLVRKRMFSYSVGVGSVTETTY